MPIKLISRGKKMKKGMKIRRGTRYGLVALRSATKRVSPNIKRYVKAMVRRNIETKQAIPLGANNVPIRPYGLDGNGPHQLTTIDIGQIFEGMNKGTSNGERIGNEISVKKLTFKGFINLDSTKADVNAYKKNPMFVKMFVGRRRDTIQNPNTYATTNYTAFEDLFEAGPLVGHPDNLPTDMYQTINKQVYQVVATRFFKIGTSSPSNVPNDSAQWNNDFSFSKFFSIDLSKHVHTIQYEADYGTAEAVRNFGLYAWFLVCFANGSTLSIVDNLIPLECHYNINATYEDA